MNKNISPGPDWFPLFLRFQVMEAHILAALTQETQHLILIGEGGVARRRKKTPPITILHMFSGEKRIKQSVDEIYVV